MKRKVSVIIPVYNAEKYLGECLDSVRSQTLSDIEVICVNDGSSDDSLNLLKSYKEKDDRICIIEKENGGASSARNAGIRAAQGEYILFLDSDDQFCAKEALECLWERADKGSLDVLYFDTTVFFESEELKEKNQNYISYYTRKKDYPEAMTGKELFISLQENWDFKPSPCLQLLRTEFLKKNDLSFCEHIFAHEDEVFTLKCIILAEQAGYLNRKFYSRRIRPDSLVTSSDKTKSILGCFFAVKEMMSFADKFVIGEENRLRECYFTRVQTLQEIGADLIIQENKESRERLVGLVSGEQRTEFTVFIREWERFAEWKRRAKETQDQKRELNAKLRQTYDEKSERGVEIKRLNTVIEELNLRLKEQNKELEREKAYSANAREKAERIQHSASYKVGKIVTYVPRKIKKVINQSK